MDSKKKKEEKKRREEWFQRFMKDVAFEGQTTARFLTCFNAGCFFFASDAICKIELKW